MAQREIKIETSEQALSLFGNFDSNIKLIEKEYRKESASNAELVEWIEEQYYHSVAEGHSTEAIIYHNGALKSVLRHINGDD